MDFELWKQVDNLLQAVLERPPEERDAFLRQACRGDDMLEHEVRSLLVSEQEAREFLESPAIEVAARAVALKQRRDKRETSVSLTGQIISHYRVIDKLGVGGMGVVWKARDSRLDRFVALKFLPSSKMSDPERKRRFAQEARAASALNHPNIITIYDIDEADGADFIAMEFVPGKALDQLMARKRLPLHEALQYAVQIADALAAAHAAGIVHRDLKPGNVMVNENGCVKVLDFGLAKLTEQSGAVEFARTQTLAHPETEEGVMLGTISYMSPEQAEAKKLDSRTDIFSFGAVLYEMLTGRHAFAGDSTASILSAILRDEPRPVVDIAPGIPGELNRIVTRCLQKDPNLRYQHAGDLKLDLQQVNQEPSISKSASGESRPGVPGLGRSWWLAAAAACVAVSFIVWSRLKGPDAEQPPWKLTRLTADAGLSGYAALSPDGKLVAYSSDRSPDGERDLYIKQIAGGQPIRLTSDGEGNTTPDFSPDGSKIVFRSSRDGGGIYEIPAFGGEARLLARDGLNPRFSPDGSQIAYWVGAEGVAAAVPGSGTVWVVSAAGGQPQQVGKNFTSARVPIWSPDGKRVLFIGYTSAKAFEGASIDWWLADPTGSEAVKTGVYEALIRAGLEARDPFRNPRSLTPVPAPPRPGCWPVTGNGVITSIASGEADNLWEIGISKKSGRVNGVLSRLTTGAGNEVDPSCASGGALAFTKVETRTDIWLLRFDLNRGMLESALERITQSPARRIYPSLSKNGHYVAFASDESGGPNILLHELTTGKEVTLARSSFAQNYPVSDSSGDRVAFSVYEKDKRVVYVTTRGGAPEKVCEGCLRATDWSRDEKSLLVFVGNPYQINMLDIASHQQTPMLKHATYNLLYGRFSPDNRWVSFTARIQPNRARIVLAPVDGRKPIPESAWITIAEVGAEDWGNWSPDGETLYYTSYRDGHHCLWGQRIDANSRQPVGEVFSVQHLHGRVSYTNGGWSAGGGRIGLSLVDTSGNVWMMSRSGPH